MIEEEVTTQNGPENPIYKFLKANNLTTKDEATFLKDYESPDKQKEIYKFMVANQLTTKDFNKFSSDNFGALKKYTRPKSFIERFSEWLKNIYQSVTHFPTRNNF